MYFLEAKSCDAIVYCMAWTYSISVPLLIVGLCENSITVGISTNYKYAISS